MAIVQSDEANILDAETTNWRLIVYPILAVLIILVGGFSYYFYLQNQREELETAARAALLQAKTPADMIKVADQFPGADQATIALLSAADTSFAARDYAAAITDYQRIIQNPSSDPELRDSAQIGLASSQEAAGKTDDALNAYLEVARRGAKSPYAPYAYTAAATIYDNRGDKDHERQILIEAASLDPDSAFVKQAQFKLKQMAPPTPPPAPAPASNAVLTPAPAPAPSAPASTPAPAAPSAPAPQK